MLVDSDNMTILIGIIKMANAFRRQVIAEGVESVSHGEALLQMGCDLAQGYGIAKPMPASEFPAWPVGWYPDPIRVNQQPNVQDDLPVVLTNHAFGDRLNAISQNHG
jgi:predicted signal transduction protein with EAL and GGDEF domain